MKNKVVKYKGVTYISAPPEASNSCAGCDIGDVSCWNLCMIILYLKKLTLKLNLITYE